MSPNRRKQLSVQLGYSIVLSSFYISIFSASYSAYVHNYEVALLFAAFVTYLTIY